MLPTNLNLARSIALLFLFVFLAACGNQDPSQSRSGSQGNEGNVELRVAPTNTLVIEPSVTKSVAENPQCQEEFEQRELQQPYQQTGDLNRYTLSSEELYGYLNLMGIDSICIPLEFGAPFINVDWNGEDDPGAIGRMVSIGFEKLYGGSGWGSGYLVYATYNFSIGSEYDIFATQADFKGVGTDTIPDLINIDGVEGFIRFHTSHPMGMQTVSKANIFPFETDYVAVVLPLGAFDPAIVDEVILEMQEGRHPKIMHENVSLMDLLVSSIQFR